MASFPFVYQNVFGGSNIYSSDVSYRLLTVSTTAQLTWPLESAAGNDDYAARIIDVNALNAGCVIFLPDARGAGVGETILFNNISANGQPILVKRFGSEQIANITSGQFVQVYLADNSTAAGTWRVVPYGASISVAQALALAGLGLRPNGQMLDAAIPQFSYSSNVTIAAEQRAALVNWQGASGVVTLPDPGAVGANWYCWIRNSGTSTSYGQLTLQPPSAILIDGLSNKVLRPTESLVLICDGIGYYTVGYGQNAQFAFDYATVPLPQPNPTTFTLSGSNLNRIAYGFSGALTQDITILVPIAKQQYWVYNATTGPFNLSIAAASSPTTKVTINQQQRLIVYCDGTQVVRANDNNVPIPVPVLQGGTGATSSSAALVNLGGSTIGRAVFTAATTAQAQQALGITDQIELTIALVLALGG